MNYKLLTAFVFLLVGCNPSESKKQIRVYFDLKGYFESEVNRLTKSAVMVDKTTAKDGVSETKKLNSIDWKNELSVFMASDINKPAWIKSYKTERKLEGSDSTEVYTALDSALHTRSLSITWNKNHEVRKVLIVNSTRNGLYDLDETLQYIPDEMYQINRIQKAKMLKENKFSVKGLFEKR
ncbi:hypothetical protein [Solitalea koreensis]|uniref:Uncharacterized protein n=1 Tax=Solitalea koreensis TaxID=543615 RepID=A0A521DXG3_9SPHI|nr:hypothetical protein [Solitalea koreensis]SMO76409.1 hypothetical protein SAMN06265350_10945 [Solitalea koreensis]